MMCAFAPVCSGERENSVDKAHTRARDCILLDLDGQLPAAGKERARALVARAALAFRRGRSDVVVRINRPDSVAGRISKLRSAPTLTESRDPRWTMRRTCGAWDESVANWKRSAGSPQALRASSQWSKLRAAFFRMPGSRSRWSARGDDIAARTSRWKTRHGAGPRTAPHAQTADDLCRARGRHHAPRLHRQRGKFGDWEVFRRMVRKIAPVSASSARAASTPGQVTIVNERVLVLRRSRAREARDRGNAKPAAEGAVRSRSTGR